MLIFINDKNTCVIKESISKINYNELTLVSLSVAKTTSTSELTAMLKSIFLVYSEGVNSGALAFLMTFTVTVA